LHNILQDHSGCAEFQLFASEEATGDGSTGDVTAGLMIHDYPEAIGGWHAKSGRYAKVKAALQAVEALQGMPPYEFRAKYGCDCHVAKERGTVEDTMQAGKLELRVVERVQEVLLGGT